MLYVIWQIVAFAVFFGAFALIFWHMALRGRRGRREGILGVVGTSLAFAGGAARAFDQWWAWLLLAAAGTVAALATIQSRGSNPLARIRGGH